MRWRDTLLLILIALASVGVLIYINRAPKKSNLFGIEVSKIEKIIVKAETGTFEAVRKGKKWWLKAQPAGEQVKEGEATPAFEDKVAEIENFTTKRDPLLAESEKEWESFGLKEPYVKIKVISKKGISREIWIGDKNPTGGFRYTKVLGDEKRVYFTSAYLADIFRRLIEEPPIKEEKEEK